MVDPEDPTLVPCPVMPGGVPLEGGETTGPPVPQSGPVTGTSETVVTPSEEPLVPCTEE